MRTALWLATIAVGVAALALSACGLTVRSPDLFLLARSGPGKPLTLLVNDGGTVRCDGGKARSLSDPLLLQARDLSKSLNADAKQRLRIPRGANSVAVYTVRVQSGTISFPDTAGATRHELATAELFAVQAAQQACGLSG